MTYGHARTHTQPKMAIETAVFPYIPFMRYAQINKCLRVCGVCWLHSAWATLFSIHTYMQFSLRLSSWSRIRQCKQPIVQTVSNWRWHAVDGSQIHRRGWKIALKCITNEEQIGHAGASVCALHLVQSSKLSVRAHDVCCIQKKKEK